MTSSPGSRPGFPFPARGFLLLGTFCVEKTARLGLFFLSLPLDVLFDLFFIQSDGRREIPDAPDAVFLKIYLSDKFEGRAQVAAAVGFEFADGI